MVTVGDAPASMMTLVQAVLRADALDSVQPDRRVRLEAVGVVEVLAM